MRGDGAVHDLVADLDADAAEDVRVDDGRLDRLPYIVSSACARRAACSPVSARRPSPGRSTGPRRSRRGRGMPRGPGRGAARGTARPPAGRAGPFLGALPSRSVATTPALPAGSPSGGWWRGVPQVVTGDDPSKPEEMSSTSSHPALGPARRAGGDTAVDSRGVAEVPLVRPALADTRRRDSPMARVADLAAEEARPGPPAAGSPEGRPGSGAARRCRRRPTCANRSRRPGAVDTTDRAASILLHAAALRDDPRIRRLTRLAVEPTFSRFDVAGLESSARKRSTMPFWRTSSSRLADDLARQVSIGAHLLAELAAPAGARRRSGGRRR